VREIVGVSQPSEPVWEISHKGEAAACRSAAVRLLAGGGRKLPRVGVRYSVKSSVCSAAGVTGASTTLTFSVPRSQWKLKFADMTVSVSGAPAG
jgi:hypothetical protein